jgi:hypothetical protein
MLVIYVLYKEFGMLFWQVIQLNEQIIKPKIIRNKLALWVTYKDAHGSRNKLALHTTFIFFEEEAFNNNKKTIYTCAVREPTKLTQGKIKSPLLAVMVLIICKSCGCTTGHIRGKNIRIKNNEIWQWPAPRNNHIFHLMNLHPPTNLKVPLFRCSLPSQHPKNQTAIL